MDFVDKIVKSAIAIELLFYFTLFESLRLYCVWLCVQVYVHDD